MTLLSSGCLCEAYAYKEETEGVKGRRRFADAASLDRKRNAHGFLPF